MPDRTGFGRARAAVGARVNGPHVQPPARWGPLFGEGVAPAATRAHAGKQSATPDPKQTLPAPSHHAAPRGTSEIAAQQIGKAAPNLRQRIFDAIAAAGPRGLTDDEAEALLGIKPQSYTPRRGELVRLGLVVDSGERRPTSSGRPAAVWVAVAFAGNGPWSPSKASSPTDDPEGGPA